LDSYINTPGVNDSAIRVAVYLYKKLLKKVNRCIFLQKQRLREPHKTEYNYNLTSQFFVKSEPSFTQIANLCKIIVHDNPRFKDIFETAFIGIEIQCDKYSTLHMFVYFL